MGNSHTQRGTRVALLSSLENILQGPSLEPLHPWLPQPCCPGSRPAGHVGLCSVHRILVREWLRRWLLLRDRSSARSSAQESEPCWLQPLPGLQACPEYDSMMRMRSATPHRTGDLGLRNTPFICFPQTPSLRKARGPVWLEEEVTGTRDTGLWGLRAQDGRTLYLLLGQGVEVATAD